MKKFTLLLFILTTTVFAQTKTATLKGNVKFEKKRYEGATPDAGATILIHKSNAVSESPQDTLGNYKAVTMLRYLVNTLKKDEYVTQLEKHNAETEEKYNVFKTKAFRYFYKIKKDPQTINATADASGNYSVQLTPGRYEVLFISANLQAENLLEVKGLIDTYFIEVKAGQVKVQDNKFTSSYQ